MNNYLMLWPKSEKIIHINYHYTQFGEVIDYVKNNIKDNIISIDQDIQKDIDILSLIEKHKITKLAMMVNYENSINSFKLAKLIKNTFSNIAIFAYGPLTIMLPNLFINSSFDVIHSNGDYEISIVSFFKYYENNLEKDINNLKGCNILLNNQMFSSSNGEFMLSDTWGISKETNVPIKEYDKIKNKNRYILNISKGCPFGCEHCLIQLTEGKKERRRSIENIKNALKIITKDYTHIKIWAANFTLDKQYVINFCKLIQEFYPNITWECATRIDLVSDIELLRLMHKSGCKQITIGVESLNNKELIHTKDFTINQISTSISNITNAGIKCKCCVMFGINGQSKKDIIETLEFLTSQNVLIRPTIYTPYHLINSEITLKSLINYNRRTFTPPNIEGITQKQLQDIVKNPYNYKKILNI